MTTEDYTFGKIVGRRTILPNGMEIYTVCSDEWDQMAIDVVVDVGGFSDGDAPGTAHILEHLLLSHEGAGHVPWMDALTLRGVRVSAITFDPNTMYSLAGPSSCGSDGLRLLLNALFYPTWTHAHFELEKRIVHQEEVEKMNTKRIQSAYIRFLYHVLAPFSALPDARLRTLEQVRTHHAEHYAPRLTRVFYAGRGPHQSVVDAVASVDVPDRPGRASPVISVPDLHPGRFSIPSPDDSFATVNFLWPARRGSEESTLWDVLAGWTWGLLYRRLRFDRGLIYQAHLHDMRFLPGHVSSVRLPTRPEYVEEVERVSEEIFEELRRTLLSPTLLAAVKAERERVEREGGERSSRKHHRPHTPESCVSYMHVTVHRRRNTPDVEPAEPRDARDHVDAERIRDEARQLLDPAKQATIIISP